MAKPPCSFDDTHQGEYVLSSYTTGDATITCEQDAPMLFLSLAAAFSDGLSAESCEALGEYFDKIAANDSRKPTPIERAKGGAKTRTEPGGMGTPAIAPDAPAGATGSAVSSAGPAMTVESSTPVYVELDPPCSECGGTRGTGDDIKLTCDSCGTVIATVDGS